MKKILLITGVLTVLVTVATLYCTFVWVFIILPIGLAALGIK